MINIYKLNYGLYCVYEAIIANMQIVQTHMQKNKSSLCALYESFFSVISDKLQICKIYIYSIANLLSYSLVSEHLMPICSCFGKSGIFRKNGGIFVK